MILIAPDKYRGTMSAAVAARTIDAALHATEPFVDPLQTMLVPLADGGEGMAACVGGDAGWVDMGTYRVNELTGEAIVESAMVVGYDNFDGVSPWDRSSAPLARVVNEIWHRHHPGRLYVGIGGTACCDGGEGFLDELDRSAVSSLYGLADVSVPLLPQYPGGPSALTFAPQKGFRPGDMPALERRLRAVVRRYGPDMSARDGAGGGLGYAFGSVLRVPCQDGANWLLNRIRIDWNDITLAITGEGRYDGQSMFGKVVETLHLRAAGHGVPTLVLAGCTGDGEPRNDDLFRVVDCSVYGDGSPLTPAEARRRLTMAVNDINEIIPKQWKR